MARSTAARASVTPPISSQTIATSGRVMVASMSVVSSAGSTSTSRFFLASERTAMARTARRAPRRAWIAAALSSRSLTTPAPTLPSPRRATPISRIRGTLARRARDAQAGPARRAGENGSQEGELLLGRERVVLGDHDPGPVLLAQRQGQDAVLGDRGDAVGDFARHQRRRGGAAGAEGGDHHVAQPDVDLLGV